MKRKASFNAETSLEIQNHKMRGENRKLGLNMSKKKKYRVLFQTNKNAVLHSLATTLGTMHPTITRLLMPDFRHVDLITISL